MDCAYWIIFFWGDATFTPKNDTANDSSVILRWTSKRERDDWLVGWWYRYAYSMALSVTKMMLYILIAVRTEAWSKPIQDLRFDLKGEVSIGLRSYIIRIDHDFVRSWNWLLFTGTRDFAISTVLYRNASRRPIPIWNRTRLLSLFLWCSLRL